MLTVFSDTHLTHRWFNPKKYHRLANIIKGSDQIIINGDFWDGLRCSFEQFIQSHWRQLFPMLKSKNAVYIYGNHDLKEWCDERTNLFSVHQAEAFDFTIGTLDLHLEHGHRIAPDPITKNPNLLNIPLIGYFDYLFTELIPTIFFGQRWINYKGRTATLLMREHAKEFAAEGRWLLCGHSHVAQLDPNIKYANSGFIGLGRLQYIRIDRYSVNLKNLRF
jgi:predicted phosphodiesterase